MRAGLIPILRTQDICSVRFSEGFLAHQCNISEKIKFKRIHRWNNDETTMLTRQREISEMLTQKKTKSWTPVGPTRARTSGTNRHKSLGRNCQRVWGRTHRRATKERSKVINRNWVNYHACSLLYYIYVMPNLYISKNEFTKLSAESIASIFFFWIYILSHHKFQVPTGLIAEKI